MHYGYLKKYTCCSQSRSQINGAHGLCLLMCAQASVVETVAEQIAPQINVQIDSTERESDETGQKIILQIMCNMHLD